jgi:hypothetical protein
MKTELRISFKNNRRTKKSSKQLTCRVSERRCHRPLPSEPDSRVREWHFCRSLPSEPDMMVSHHPAQAIAKPRVSRVGQRRNSPRDLDDIHLPPADRTRTFEPVGLVRLWRSAGGCTHGLRHVHLRFPSARVLQVFSSRLTGWKSARLRGGTLLQPLSVPLRTAFAFSSFRCPSPRQRTLR